VYAYVARQAIFNKDKHVHAYELLFRNGKDNCYPEEMAPDEATSKILANSHLNMGLEDITGGRTAFINFYEDTLLYRFPTSLDPFNVVIEVLETIPISEELLAACKHIKNLGYKLALDDHDFDPKWDVFLPIVDIIKVDIKESTYETIAANIPKFLDAGVELVAEKIETHEEFEQYKELGFHYFQGYFFARPEVMKKRSLPASRLTMVELMSASSSSNLDFTKVNNIIERDVSLSYMLLRFINNPTVNKRYKISSLRHALNYMGEVEIKKFIALLALANLSDDKPSELITLSLVRAKFCELIAIARKDQENPPKGFLVGMFSLLDALLDQKMQHVTEKLPILDDIKQALCGEEGYLLDYLLLAEAFEQANWRSIQRQAKKLELSQKLLHSFYNEALKWGNAMKLNA